MPNRRALSRGGPLEATVLENLRQGHSVRAACAAAGVPVRTFYNHSGRSAAFRHDVEVAAQEAERRLVGIVLEAAATDAKHAEWLLARRWPAAYGDRQQIDMNATVEQEGGEVLALARRYAAMTDVEITQELRRLAWVPIEQPGAVLTAAPGDRGVQRLNGEAAMLHAPKSSTDDVGPDTATAPAEAPEVPDLSAAAPDVAPQTAEPQPPLVWHPGPEPIRCIHCRGTHEAACPDAVAGAYRIDPFDMGDPR